jgi:hypothetical protein
LTVVVRPFRKLVTAATVPSGRVLLAAESEVGLNLSPLAIFRPANFEL